MATNIKPENKCKIAFENLDLICGLCLAVLTEEAPSRNLTQKEYQLLKGLADMEITGDPHLPNKVCTNCETILNTIINFVSEYKKNYQILKMHLQEKQKTDENGFVSVTSSHNIEYEENYFDPYNIKRHKNVNSNYEVCNVEDKKDLMKQDDGVFSTEIVILKNETSSKEKYVLDSLEEALPKCTYCSKRFKFKSRLKRHIFRHEVKLGLVKNKLICIKTQVKLKIKCRLCEKIFRSRSGYQYHKLKHEKKLVPKRCKSKTTNMKKFLCNYCAKSFIVKCHLDEHLRTHTGEKPYKCNFCPKEFKQKGALNRHSLVHEHDKQLLFLCEICQKNFTTKAHRDIHVRIHSGEKPYECKFCKKRFNYKTQWRIHLRLHTGETPFECQICKNTYHDKGSLRKHQKRKCHVLMNGKKIESDFAEQYLTSSV